MNNEACAYISLPDLPTVQLLGLTIKCTGTAYHGKIWQNSRLVFLVDGLKKCAQDNKNRKSKPKVEKEEG